MASYSEKEKRLRAAGTKGDSHRKTRNYPPAFEDGGNFSPGFFQVLPKGPHPGYSIVAFIQPREVKGNRKSSKKSSVALAHPFLWCRVAWRQPLDQSLFLLLGRNGK